MNHDLLGKISHVPNDLELVIPGNVSFLEALLVIAFILHIVFVNVIVAGSANALFLEFKGILRKNSIYDELARHLATHVSINKSIAVVLGVAPLLIISTIYTQFFYPSTILIGKMWLLLVPLLILSFLLLYVYKFTWEVWQKWKGLHLAFGLLGTAILLFVPLVFIVNVASMLYPELWQQSRGFFASLFAYPTIWQRYAHFMASSFAVMGLYMYWWGGRRLKKEDDPVFVEAKRFGKREALLFTVLQLLAGPLLLFSMDERVTRMFLGGSALHVSLLAVTIVLAVALIFMLVKLVQKESRRTFVAALTLLCLMIGTMSILRHEVRELYLQPYQQEAPRTVQAVQAQN
ncbi:MAG: cytochrome c class I [Clostridia bacterium]